MKTASLQRPLSPQTKGTRSPYFLGFFVIFLVGACANGATPEVQNDVLQDAHDSAASVLDAAPSEANEGLPSGPSSTRHVKHSVGTTYAAQGFWEYLPENYGDGQRWPLILFFHGKGENGSGSDEELELVLKHGPPHYIANDLWPIAGSQSGDDFVVLSVQNAQEGCHRAADIAPFLDWALEQYDVNSDQVYLVAHSCGARGIWNYLKDYLQPQKVAAVLPIAGNGVEAWELHKCALGVMPIWAFHGSEDSTMQPIGTHTPMDGLADCVAPKAIDARKTIYDGVGHNSWAQTYDLSAGHDVFAWLLSHTVPGL